VCVAPQDYRKPGSMGEQYFIGLETVLGGSGDPAYPGGQFFNMFNLGKVCHAYHQQQQLCLCPFK
jgi:hypothetical protein